LLESIAAANDELGAGIGATVLSRNPERFLARMPHLAARREFDWLPGHPTNFSFPVTRHDYLLHLATATSACPDRTNPTEMLQTKFSGILRVLDYARQAGIRRMLVTSSGAVYGPQPAELSHIPETYPGAPDPLDPASAYGNGKRLVEQVCALAQDIDTVIARCFSFIGPHLPLDARFAAGNFIRDALAGGPIVVKGDGRALRSYLHAADLTIWLLTLLVRGRPRCAYNVGSDTAISTAQLAIRIGAAFAADMRVEVKGVPGTGPAVRYVPDISRARNELGLGPLYDLDRSIAATCRAAATILQRA